MKARSRSYFRGYHDFLGPFGAQRLSPFAQAMLLALLAQYKGNNNGSLKITASVLPHRWRSNHMRQKTRDELLNEGFVFEVSRGRRPNVASLYALACYPLDENPEHDADLAEHFDANAWRRPIPREGIGKKPRLSHGKGQRTQKRYPLGRDTGDFAIPREGIESPRIVPPEGTTGRNRLSLGEGTFLEVLTVLPGGVAVGAGK